MDWILSNFPSENSVDNFLFIYTYIYTHTYVSISTHIYIHTYDDSVSLKKVSKRYGMLKLLYHYFVYIRGHMTKLSFERWARLREVGCTGNRMDAAGENSLSSWDLGDLSLEVIGLKKER